MQKYLISRILVLALFLASIIVMPFAAWLGFIIAGVCAGITLIKSITSYGEAKRAYSPAKIGVIVIIGAIFVLYGVANSYGLLEAVLDNERLFNAVICGCIIYISRTIFRRFMFQERDCYIIDSKIDKCTKYPTLLFVMAIVGIIVNVIFMIIKDTLPAVTTLLNIVLWVCNVLFVLAIVQYIVRMIHIYKCNNF